jgi:hypothetical protein
MAPAYRPDLSDGSLDIRIIEAGMLARTRMFCRGRDRDARPLPGLPRLAVRLGGPRICRYRPGLGVHRWRGGDR